MVIDGKELAERILKSLVRQVKKLKTQGVNPTLVILLVGRNPVSLAFVKQKQKKAAPVGIKVLLKNLPSASNKQKIQQMIQKYNLNPKAHGIIVQLPLPPKLENSTQEVVGTVAPKKDVDGFVKNSLYAPAVSLATLKVLEVAARNEVQPRTRSNLVKWLEKKEILIIGRGLTAGKPIAQTFNRLGIPFTVAHSRTKNPEKLIKNSDIVISCVGKENLIKGGKLKKGAIVIGVGMTRNRQGKLVGDLEEESVGKVASFYTPTPGGTGPLTVAYLLENLVKACYSRNQRVAGAGDPHRAPAGSTLRPEDVGWG